jgi:hypothetical protein
LPPMLNAERLAYWYLRLNGFMTIDNFVLHDKSKKGIAHRTDADIYGVRFPFRSFCAYISMTRSHFKASANHLN